MLGKAFTCVVLLLHSAWTQHDSPATTTNTGQPSAATAVEAAGMLDALSWLQFCRLRLTAYSTLLQSLVAAVMARAEVHPALCHRRVRRPCCISWPSLV